MTPYTAPLLDVHGGLQAALEPGALSQIPVEHLARWLGQRRWFGAKGRTMESARFRSIALLPVQGRTFALTVLEITFGQPSALSRYQLPLLVSPAEVNVPLPPSVLARVHSADEWGILSDATEDPVFQMRIGELLRDGATVEGIGARWVFEQVGTGTFELPATSRLGHAEQSNSSLLYGDAVILKLFRRLEAGEHPDAETARFLTTRTTFRNTPELLGVIRLEEADGSSVAGMFSRFVSGATDAWAHALTRVRENLAVRDDPAPNPFAAEARALGEVTRSLHEALSSVVDNPAFARVHVSGDDVAKWAGAARLAAEEGFDLLERLIDSLDAASRESAQALLRRRAAALARVDAIARDFPAGDAGLRVRHHGDYHLGQVLRAPGGEWMIIDFEGEPSRPLEARRALHSPLRDVAGMLRSFAYAAASGAMEAGGIGVDARVELRTARWEREARSAFLAGYFGGQTAPHSGLLPAKPSSATALVTLFEAEKIFYELAYELNNRPSWTWIPLRGIARLF